jgi:hypothetical protein
MLSTLLECSVCGSPLHVHGKVGAFLRTECTGCGLTSDSMIQKYLKDQEERSARKVEVQYVRRGR